MSECFQTGYQFPISAWNEGLDMFCGWADGRTLDQNGEIKFTFWWWDSDGQLHKQVSLPPSPPLLPIHPTPLHSPPLNLTHSTPPPSTHPRSKADVTSRTVVRLPNPLSPIHNPRLLPSHRPTPRHLLRGRQHQPRGLGVRSVSDGDAG